MKLLRSRTLTFLQRHDEVLLGLKKRGFGKDYLLGIGGKVEDGETIEEAAYREVAEEIHVLVPVLHKRGILNFYFPHVEDGSWDQQVHVFTTTHWEGEPQESQEIRPAWFEQAAIPCEKMWDDARYWLPQVLAHQWIEGDFIFDKDLRVKEYTIRPLR